MDYLIPIACFAGGIWTGYLVGQFASIKETNRRLAALQYESDGWKQEAGWWRDILDKTNEERDEYKAGVEHWIAESDRQADIIARYQAKAPERDTSGKFTSKKARVTAELKAYVASKKAVQ